MSANAPVLEFDHVSGGYGGPDVIREISLSVSAGEVVGLFGANGAGKTTSLRAASGLLQPTAGTIRFAGVARPRSVQRLARAGLAHVTEGRSVFPGLTVDEHFLIGTGDAKRARSEAFTLFPALAPLGGRRAGVLSGGEQQMLSLARALVRHPRLLLIDELSLGLAPVIVSRLLPQIRAYADRGGAVVLVEQHVSLALAFVDRGYVLSHGNVTHAMSADALRADRSLLISSYFGD